MGTGSTGAGNDWPVATHVPRREAHDEHPACARDGRMKAIMRRRIIAAAASTTMLTAPF
jgi:hypothetical protein